MFMMALHTGGAPRYVPRRSAIARLRHVGGKTGLVPFGSFLARVSSVGQLLSLSLPTYRLRWMVRAGSANAFLPGGTLLRFKLRPRVYRAARTPRHGMATR